MDKKTKKKVIIIIVLVYALVIGLLIFTARSLTSRDPAAKTGLFKSDEQIVADAQPVHQTEQERKEEYENREEMPQITEEIFYSTINQFLSMGNFTEMDKTLRRWQETYKDSLDESESKTAMIERYRGDLTYYIGIKNNGEALDKWMFKTADTLASCIAYTPIMQKYNAFVNQDSVLFPAMEEGTPISLSKSALTNEELAELKKNVNRTRTDETAFLEIEAYDLTILGYPCQFIAVMDRDTMTWMPYSLKVTNNMLDLPTVSIGKEILRGNPNGDLDVSIAVPAMISERPEGMEGNITQEDIPSSETLDPIVIESSTPEKTETEKPAETSAEEALENASDTEDQTQA